VPGLRLIHLASIDDLRRAAAAWDDLWTRSGVTLPTARAELLAQWVEQFEPRARFHALVVEDGDRWVAALPLAPCTLGHLMAAGGMPSNEWSDSGDLLLDADADDPGAALDTLVAGMAELPWQLLWLNDVVADAPRWQALRAAIARAEMPSDFRPRLQVGRIEIDHDWDACRQRWSRKHRQQMARHVRQLDRRGDLQLALISELTPGEVESYLRVGFQIEDRSWKGEAGTSVLRAPAMFDFFLRQAEQLAAWGQLQLAFLRSGGHPIAFGYGMAAKGVYHSCKIGYDPVYADYSPGQLLRYGMIERFHGDPAWRALDCRGPMTPAHRCWRPTPYTVGRLAVAPRGLSGRLAIGAYRRWWPKQRCQTEVSMSKPQCPMIIGH
jgi:CelD/BcsL family acetyltransferase involved in cellulose biosynthesis